MTSSNPVDVVKTAYAAFGRGDVAAIVALCDDKIDWQFNGGTRVPYSGRFGKADVANWFGNVAKFDDVQSFEPREFIPGGEHVTVIGWERCAARPSGRVFESPWVHVFTVKNGKVTRFWGIYDTEASSKAR
jgi:ketosteroid isomerase-like protein